MLYISSEVDGMYGITDTDDATTQFFNRVDVLAIAQQLKIYGVFKEEVYKMTPVKAPLAANIPKLEYELRQCISELRASGGVNGKPVTQSDMSALLTSLPACAIEIRYTSLNSVGRRHTGYASIVKSDCSFYTYIEAGSEFHWKTSGVDFAVQMLCKCLCQGVGTLAINPSSSYSTSN